MGIKLTSEEIDTAINHAHPYQPRCATTIEGHAIANAATAKAVEEIDKMLSEGRLYPPAAGFMVRNSPEWKAIKKEAGVG